ncbi:sigma-54 dependent transcriptional regulator [bacterium]|nr:sigma-54 dependent transcriptional regulator [bacterium]
MSNLDSSGCKILIADDEPVTLRMFQRYLELAGMVTVTAKDGKEALAKMSRDIQVAILDLNMPGMTGLECMRKIRVDYPGTEILIISGVGQISDAVAAMKAGACEFVTKPCNQEDLIARVEQAIRTARLSRENQQLRMLVEQPPSSTDFAATTEQSKDLLKKITKLAELDSTILLTGESGTGKTTIARMIHNLGPRSGQAFVAVNCASLPRDLIEAELFGHVKGAFSDAEEDRPGRAEIADGGTLFLDEIGDLPLELQPKLLTFLHEKTFQRIGSNQEVQVDVRVISASHQDLAGLCEERRFRADLYYRLNVLKLHILALRERQGDIPTLVEAILERIARRRGIENITLSDEACSHLLKHNWPGNIRELENIIERASAFCEHNRIAPDDLDLSQKIPSNLEDTALGQTSLAGQTLKEIEKRALIDTLEAEGGNKAMAARQLGVSEKSIYNKLRRFDLYDDYKQ